MLYQTHNVKCMILYKYHSCLEKILLLLLYKIVSVRMKDFD